MPVGSTFDNEGQLQKAAITALELAGAFVENRAPSYWGTRAVDLTGILHGTGFAIELKNPKHYGPPGDDDKRWPLQKSYLKKVEKAGGYALGTNIISAVHDLINDIRDGIRSKYREAWHEHRIKKGISSRGISINRPCKP